MKTHFLVSSSLLLLLAGSTARADSLINNFTAPYDYVANGIIGDTNWDGMYLRFGDVPGGIVGGNPAGSTLIANSAITYAGYLSLRSSGGDWAGADDDGVLLWKLVAGDFDVSVQSSPFNLNGGTSFDNGNYQMAGLMARAYHPDNSGAPYSTTTTNAAENYVMLLRFQEFGLNEVNEARDGIRIQHILPETDADTGSTRYFRMVRTSLTNFTFFWKTNASDSWVQITNDLPAGGVLVRSDLTGPLQVGIAQAPFSSATHDAVFTDFELSGTNVTFPSMPAGPSALVTTATNTTGTLTFSWSLGAPGDSSLVVMSRQPIQYNPVQGRTYMANPGFGTPSTRLGGAGEYVVYAGTGTSVTVTNLGANNLVYYVAVFEYSSSSGPVYNTASPATNAYPGPGIITGASLSAFTNTIPINGALPLRLMANFSTGDTSDQTINATWASSDPTVAVVNDAGVVTGITNGTATITGSFGTYSPTLAITVHTPAFTDDFGTTQDYVANGLLGSRWDGLFLNYGDVPGASKGNDGVAGQTFQLIADTNTLFVQAAGGSWRVAGNDGPFLFKIVSGDFQASVHVTSGIINNNYAGIMARLYNNSHTASQGGGGGAGGTETHVNWGNPQQGTPSARMTVDSGGASGNTAVVAGLNPTDHWLLMVRQNSTNFLVFEKASATDPWLAVPAATMVLTGATNNAPMEVGLFQEMRNAATDVAQFDNVMLDGPGLISPSGTKAPPSATELVATVNADLSLTVTWVSATALGAPAQSTLVMRDGGPVTAQPNYGMGFTVGAGTYAYGTGMSLGDGNYVVFRSANPPPSTNNTATITGLTPGHTYYVSAYTFGGVYPDRVFAAGVSTHKQDGLLQGISTPTIPTIPVGGIELAKVIGTFSGGTLLDISSAATVVSTNASVVVATNNILTGIANGTATVAIYVAGSPYTNYVPVTVRPPVFTDNFGINHDYLVNGVGGSAWDGVYRQGVSSNEVPDSPYVLGAGLGTVLADANVSSNNLLTVTAMGDGWENELSGGFFLFKRVPGDFQAAVHVNSYDIAQYNQPGLLARAYSAGTNGTAIGAPFVIGPMRTNANDVVLNPYGENWVSFCRFDEYNFGCYPRLTLDSVTQQSAQPGENDGNNWLLIVRRNGTNFSFYMRASAAAPWQPTPGKVVYQQAEFAGAPMEVGLMAGAWSNPANDTRTVRFDSFMLDQTGGSVLSISIGTGAATLSWPPIANAALEATDSLSTPNWQPVPGTPVLGPNGYSLTVPLGPGSRFFRLRQ